MAKKGNKSSNVVTPPAQTYALPEGYEKRSDDVVGFWDPELSGGPLHFVPREAAVFDGKTEPEKPGIIIFGDLVDACTLIDAEGQPKEGKPGDRIGLWGKPGMKAIKTLAGVRTFLYPAGERDVGKPQPMKLFEVASAREGDALPVDDRRRRSRGKATFLTPALTGQGFAQRRKPAQEDDGDYAEDYGF